MIIEVKRLATHLTYVPVCGESGVQIRARKIEPNVAFVNALIFKQGAMCYLAAMSRRWATRKLVTRFSVKQ